MQPAPYTDAAGRRDFHAPLGAGPVGRPLTRPVAGCPLGFPPWSAVVARDRGVGRDTPRSSRASIPRESFPAECSQPVCCALSEIAVRRLGTTRPCSRRRVGQRAGPGQSSERAAPLGRGAQSFQRINNRGVLRSERFRSPRSKPDASHHVGASRMAKDIEQQLDAIFAHHKARVEQARNEAAGKTVTEEDFTQAATACLASVIAPALRQMAQALNERGVAARVLTEGSDARIDIPVSRHVRLGHGLGGYPYLRARPDRLSQRIQFGQNTYGSHGSRRGGRYTIAEVNAELVKAKVIGLVRELYGPV